ncbi:MAG TPA: glycosyltransferase family 39 protein [Chitinophagaceae bacterium]|nr:glycosyltransferase family 39 protein [Chitinophagaceae bacterium]
MTSPLLPKRVYLFLFSLLGLVYITGLFIPLMDNDAGHHANIALRMYLTGDYITLYDHRGDYIDKPHFLFWTSALSYHVFGVTSFAYRLPSFLFTLLGTYSIFRLAKDLYDHETGKLGALIAASSFCYILANNDVRMDAILTAAIAFATWQLIAWVHHQKFLFLVGAALGLAIGFSTKGHVGLVTPVAGLFFYLLYKKDWKLLYDWHWLIVILLFALFISPVVYCYYLQFNLHPEKISQGMKGVNGVKYILWSHSFDRISGHERFGGSLGKEDKFFFLHTFLWTFAPWCFVALVALFIRLKNFLSKQEEWLSTGVFVMLALLINFSNFKLPHYMPILAPATAAMVAHLFASKWNHDKWKKALWIIQLSASLLLLIVSAAVNTWAFPIHTTTSLIGLILILAIAFYFLLTKMLSTIQKAIAISVTSIALFFFLANTNFYPQLLTYQGGKPLADETKGIVDPNHVYFWKNTFSSSFNFYSESIRRVYPDSLNNPVQKFWLVYEKSQQPQIDSIGFALGKTFSVRDYEITRLKKSFIDPVTRKQTLDSMIMAEVVGRNK